jgi:amino acid transporter
MVPRGFWAGWNFFLYEAILIPFEISALNLVLKYWSDDIPVAAVVAVCIVLYFAINAFVVKAYGETEFWLALGKVLLILIVFSFTFITMVGGNPVKDAYGLRYWNNPGAFAEYNTTGDLGRFEGFLGSLWSAAFTVVGPEYLSMLSGEVKLPRTYLKNAFKVTYVRFAFFFIGSALCVGIVIPYNEKTLLDILAGNSGGGGSAAASPYVIAMRYVQEVHTKTQALLTVGQESAHQRSSAPRQCASMHVNILRWKCLYLLRNPFALRSCPRKPGT